MVAVSLKKKRNAKSVTQANLRYNFGCEIFFFKQKTAYEIGVRLVGSEMCIRDRHYMAIHGYTLLYMVIHGNTWPYMAIHDIT